MKNDIETTGGRAWHGNLWPHSGPPGYTAPYPERPPASWYLLSSPAACAVSAAVVEVLDENLDKTKPGDRAFLVHRIRERLMAWREAGDTASRAAVAELGTPRLNNSPILDDAVRELLAEGSLRLTLQRDRTERDRLLEHLAERAAARLAARAATR